MSRIYLDAAATTPLAPGVSNAMAPWLGANFGNPSSMYQEGRAARAAIDEAREILSTEMVCEFGELLFTSSGTESATMAILGVALANLGSARNRFVFSAAEHHCVLETQELLESLGFGVDIAPVDRQGRLDLDHFSALMDDDVLLTAVMSANNEVGTLQPIEHAITITKSIGALTFCDAVQSFGSAPIRADSLGADMISLSAHKVGGPKGVGALYVRAGTKLRPIIPGGGQEREARAGTENVAGIVGFGAAVRKLLGDESRNVRKLAARDAFWERLASSDASPIIFTVSDRNLVLSGHCHVRFEGVSAESMLIRLDSLGVSASSGAACSSGSIEPSHVLMAMGLSEAKAKEGLRFTFGWSSTVEEAVQGADLVLEAARAIRS